MPRQMSGEEYRELHDLVVEATREGRVTDWVERIAEIARLAGIRLEMINWDSSPWIVAGNIVRASSTWCSPDGLRQAVTAYQELDKGDG